MTKTKVVCVGFQKTGTTSLGKALELLGYRECGYWHFRDLATAPPEGVWDTIVERARGLVDEFDAFKDTPWPLLYREIDEWAPGSKFILITRDTDRWIRSVVRDFGEHENAIHRHIYGVGYPLGNEDAFIRRYEAHNAEILAYFKDRPEDFLHLHLDAGEVSWERVCPFLGVPTPDTPWPHANTYRNKRMRMFMGRLQRKVGAIFGRGGKR